MATRFITKGRGQGRKVIPIRAKIGQRHHKVVKVFSFGQLSGDVKEKVIEDYRKDMILDFEGFIENYKTYANDKYGFTDVDWRYSLSYSQGDGASFTGGVDIEKFLRLRGLTKKYGELLKRFKDGDLNVEFKLISNDSHYVHEKSVDVEFNFDMYSDKLSFDKYYNMAYELTEDIDKVRLQLCKQFEEDGYKHVEYEQSDEQITESILANEYEYLADGTQI